MPPDNRERMIKGRRNASHTLAALLLLALGLASLFAYLLHQSRAETAIVVEPPITRQSPNYEDIDIDFGRGYIGAGWQLYFNEPDEGIHRSEYANGLDARLAAAIDRAQFTLDIAAFELNSAALRDAILRAHERGLLVRIVSDDAHGLEDQRDDHLRQLRQAGIAIRDDSRTGLMHNKFAIIDQRAVWTGSLNYTVNGSYRNNNNMIALHSPHAAAAYQAEFDEMFERGEFGTRSSNQGPVSLELDGGEIEIIFAPEADELSPLLLELAGARQAIRFMAFVFSLEPLAEAMLLQAAYADVQVEGVFENRNSLASWSQLPALHCAGANVRQDGNRYTLHHKVIIIDDHTVITGSFNFSRSAAESNDENLLIIRHSDIAALYLEEWRHIWDSAEALAPGEVDCA